MFSEKSKKNADACRFCWMCRHLCPVQLVTGKETNTPRAKGLLEKTETVIGALPLRGKQAAWSAKVEEQRDTVSRALTYVELYGAYTACEAIYGVDRLLAFGNGLVTVRPTGPIEGDTPEAVMSRLEGAIARRDFLAADTLIATLPAPMRAAAGDVPALVAAQAEAARFLTALRTSALSGEVTP